MNGFFPSPVCRGLIVLLSCLAALPAAAQDKLDAEKKSDAGRADLLKAVEKKLEAGSLFEQAEVIALCQRALERGLNAEDKTFCQRLLVATFLQRGGRVGEAVVAAAEDPRQFEQMLRLRQMALEDLENALKVEKDLPAAHLLIGRLQALPGGDDKKALAALDDAIRLEAGRGKRADAGRLTLAYVSRAALREKPDDQLADYNQAVKLSPRDSKARLGRALFHLRRNKPQPALVDIDAAVQAEPDEARGHELRGAALALLKKYPEAKKSLDQAIQLAPQSAGSYIQRARVSLVLGNGQAAMNDINKVLAGTRASPELLLLRAGAFQLLKDAKRAMKDVEAALALKPNMPEALRARAMLRAGNGKISEAIGDLELLKKSGVKDVATLLQLGMLYYSNKQIDKAIETFSTVLKQQPDNSDAYSARADAYLQQGDHTSAIGDYRQALKHEPKNSHVLNNLAWLLATSPKDKVRNGKQAIELAKLACEVTKYKQAHILSTLAAGYAETGDFPTAIEWSQKAVDLGTGETRESLKKELESYKAGKPWREKVGEK